MLSISDIKRAINEGKIEITVSFGIKDGKIKFFDQEQKLLSSESKKNLYSDRLKLTLGPIIKVLKNRNVPSKYRFKNHKDLFDMRKSEHQFFINPGESVIVLTNERMRLNGKYACLVVPRISLSDVGIVVTTAYVDPYYNGVMRLHISNVSNKVYELHTLEAIAQCFFFEMSESVDQSFKDQFPQKSVFFGQTWHGILDSDRNPFPTKKSSTNKIKNEQIKNQISQIREFIRGHSIIVGILTNLFFIISAISLIWQQYTNMNTSVKQLREIFTSKASEVIISTGEKRGEKVLNFDVSKSDIISVLCDNDNINYQIMSGPTQSETVIVFSYEVADPVEDTYVIPFNYTIVGSIE